MSTENLKFKQDGNNIIMSDEQVYTKETLPGLYNSLNVHLEQLNNQIKSNELQKANAEKNLSGLNKDKEVLEGRLKILETFAAKAHIPVKPILENPKVNPQAAAQDNMKNMIKDLIAEVLDEQEKEIAEQFNAIPKCIDPEVFASYTEMYDKVKYIIYQVKEIECHKFESLIGVLHNLDELEGEIIDSARESVTKLMDENYLEIPGTRDPREDDVIKLK